MGIYSDRLYCDGWDWFEQEPKLRRFYSDPSRIPGVLNSWAGVVEVVYDSHGVLLVVTVMSWGSRYEKT